MKTSKDLNWWLRKFYNKKAMIKIGTNTPLGAFADDMFKTLVEPNDLQAYSMLQRMRDEYLKNVNEKKISKIQTSQAHSLSRI